jgi:transcriptional regulator with XRE-family HTH domain
MRCGVRWAMFSARLRDAVAASGYSVRVLAEKTQISQRTLETWIRPKDPAIPRADEAAKLARFLETTVEELSFGSVAQDVREATAPYSAYSDIIQSLNKLPDYRLNDVRRLIGPWANEVRGASMQVIDIVADLKVLSSDRLEDLRRLIGPWALESEAGNQERAKAAG